MLQKALDRKNIKVKNGVFHIFDCKGFFFGINSWYISIKDNPYFFRMNPFSQSEELGRYIEDSVSYKNLENLRYIQIMPDKAVGLYLEGKITEDDMYKAFINDGSVIIEDIELYAYQTLIRVHLVIKPYED